MFIPIEIEQAPGFGFQGTPTFSTNIIALANGRERRNADWSIARHSFSFPYLNIPASVYLAIKSVFLIVRGRNHTFLHKDWSDFEVTDEQVGIGDAAAKTFQLIKTYADETQTYTYVRNITKPLLNSVVVKVDGVATACTVNYTSGEITFAAAPADGAVITWSGEFRVPVRFDADTLPFTLDNRAKQDGEYVMNGTLNLMEDLDE